MTMITNYTTRVVEMIHKFTFYWPQLSTDLEARTIYQSNAGTFGDRTNC